MRVFGSQWPAAGLGPWLALCLWLALPPPMPGQQTRPIRRRPRTLAELAQMEEASPPALAPPLAVPAPTRPNAVMPVPARPAAAADDELMPEGEVETIDLTYKSTPLSIVLDEYSQRTGRTLLQAPGTPQANINLQSQGPLTLDEYLLAVETVLGMNGIALLEVGDRFLKVVPIAQARKEAMGIREGLGEPLPDGPTLVSQLVTLLHIDLAEAKQVIDPLKHAYGQLHFFERTNSILLTDTAENINRMLQLLSLIDQPIEAREEPHIIGIKHTKASDIKGKLEEIIAEQQQEQQKSTVPRLKTSGPPGVEPTPSTSSGRKLPGIIRYRRPSVAVAASEPASTTLTDLVADAERGIIRGKVKIIADDRTNILIIITRPENMKFFDKIVNVLDVETAPDVLVRVFRLEFAEADSIAGMLNDLIGATATAEDKAAGAAPGAVPEGESKTLREIETRPPVETAEARQRSKIGELSKDNIKILSDERTNSLVIMASRGDLLTLEEIIRDMDMMLSQVLIEAVIVEVKLSEDVQTGLDWLQRSMIAYNQTADGARKPLAAFTGRGGGGVLTPGDATGALGFPEGGGLTYYLTLFDLNLDAVVRMVSTDSKSRIVSTPVILTTDNTEATITSTEQIYVFKGVVSLEGSSNTRDDFDTQKVGLTLEVKPHINENKTVMMEIAQTISEPGDVGPPQSGQIVSSERTLDASIAVQDRQTIVLGGLVRKSGGKSRTKVPIAGDIPFLGRLFNFSQDTDSQTETVVFITPYVLDTADQIAAESMRRKRALNIQGLWQRGWSDSKLADGPTRAQVSVEQRRLRRRPPRTVRPRAAPASPDPVQELDPEFRKFMEQQERLLERPLREADEWVESEAAPEEDAR